MTSFGGWDVRPRTCIPSRDARVLAEVMLGSSWYSGEQGPVRTVLNSALSLQ